MRTFVLVVHLGFVLFVVLGGLCVLRRPGLAWLHVPAAAWGAFIDHYVRTLLYPDGLTRAAQLVLGTLVLLVNVTIYSVLVRRLARPGADRRG